MILIKPKQWFDLNKLALGFIVVIGVIVIFYSISLVYKILIESFLFTFFVFITKKIQSHENLVILLNNEGFWLLKEQDETEKVEVKDYWIVADKLFFWLKGSNKSLAFMLSRRIIGAQNYSKIRSLIS